MYTTIHNTFIGCIMPTFHTYKYIIYLPVLMGGAFSPCKDRRIVTGAQVTDQNDNFIYIYTYICI